jgi:hypothetical protein
MDRIASLDDGLVAGATSRGWIHSPPFDMGFLLFPALAGFALALIAVEYVGARPAVLFAGAYLLGVPHYLASFAFFCGDENRAHARRQWPLFYLVPVLILAGVAAFYLIAAAAVIHAILFVWNVYHVASQSSGVLSLYRRLSGGTQGERRLAHGTILFSNAAMASYAIEHFPPLRDPLVTIHPMLPQALLLGFGALAVGFAAAYARELRRRGFPLSLPELLCLGIAILLFTPYLWLADADFATLTMLMGHFVQYLAIVWLLSNRKYAPSAGSPAQRWIARLTRSWATPILFIVASGTLWALFERSTMALNAYIVFMVLFNSLALVHFYLDGLIWAFRDPYIRRTVGPFLTLDRSRLR